ncbi:MAG TPA: hypothetical protein VGP90_11245 [Acidimicrobiia bacterium]|nr:hypothetical protein [Acidimicrobiia bacterium]
MGPIAFVLVFLLVPLAAALLAGAFFAAVVVGRLLGSVPASVWATLAVAAVTVLAARLWQVVRGIPSRPPP